MTRAQFIALLIAVGGAGFGAGRIDFKTAGATEASATFIHALRVAAPVLSDGGLLADTILAYRTSAVAELDGGLDLSDVGPAVCTGDTAPLRAFAANCKLSDAGTVRNIRVIEARPESLSDGGVGVVFEIYGTQNTADGGQAPAGSRCTVDRVVGFKNFIDSLNCTGEKPRSKAKPL